MVGERKLSIMSKTILKFVLEISSVGNKITEIETVVKKPFEEKKQYQLDKLKKIILHSYYNCNYYKRIFAEANVVNHEGVNIDNFHKIPILTKGIIREQKDNIVSQDYRMRKAYENTSGGSTGEPICFLQDKEYSEWNIATKLFFMKELGKRIGEPEIKLWGSDRDIIKGNLSIKDRVMNKLYNRCFFNTYNLSESKIKELIELNNSYKPKTYWAYVDATYEIAQYINKRQIELHNPDYIITTIGPLYTSVRKEIEKAFGCKVYNQYGSRELGAIASENTNKYELQVFFWRHFVELITKEGKDQGKLCITSLDNYSMPLIRYEIGDVALPGSAYYDVANMRSFFTIGDVIGRTLGFFKKEDGTHIHTHFIVQQFFFKKTIKKFKLIQKDFNVIQCLIVGTLKKEEMEAIEKNIKILMGDRCNIVWKFVEYIPPSPSGKQIYTISEI